MYLIFFFYYYYFRGRKIDRRYIQYVVVQRLMCLCGRTMCSRHKT